MMPDRKDANASDIVQSESDEEHPVPPVITFEGNKPVVSGKGGYSTFEEANAAADAEAEAEAAYETAKAAKAEADEEDAYGVYNNDSMDFSEDATKKSIIKGPGTSNSKANDGFARVTWTDLAMGKKTFGRAS